MAYITADDLILRFGSQWLTDVADRDGDGTPDSQVIETAIQDAETAIHGKLHGIYVVPFSAPTAAIVQITAALARYLLYFDPPDYVRDGYKDALSRLDDIRQGRFPINAPLAAPASSGMAGGGRVKGVSDPAVFTASALAGF